MSEQTQLDRIENKLDKHIELSSQQHLDIAKELVKSDMRLNATDAILNNHAEIIQEVIKIKNKAIGFAAAFVLAGSLLTYILKLIFS